MAAGDTTERLGKAWPVATGSAPRRPYQPPRLVRYGDVRDVTLGPSPGVGESGAPGVLKA